MARKVGVSLVAEAQPGLRGLKAYHLGGKARRVAVAEAQPCLRRLKEVVGLYGPSSRARCRGAPGFAV